MSEPEKFLDRWSRRKREEADEPAPAAAKDAPAAPLPPVAEENAPVAFDPASLPSIESIGADSDIRAFLQPGVPPDLSRAALRRAWSADPAIRDFIGLVENGWDFNDPNSMPGFGPITAGDVARLLAQVIGASPSPESDAPQQIAQATGEFEQIPPREVHSEQVEQLPQDQLAPDRDVAPPEKDSMPRSKDDVALQKRSDDRKGVPPSRRHGHGGALPK